MEASQRTVLLLVLLCVGIAGAVHDVSDIKGGSVLGPSALPSNNANTSSNTTNSAVAPRPHVSGAEKDARLAKAAEALRQKLKRRRERLQKINSIGDGSASARHKLKKIRHRLHQIRDLRKLLSRPPASVSSAPSWPTAPSARRLSLSCVEPSLLFATLHSSCI